MPIFVTMTTFTSMEIQEIKDICCKLYSKT